LLKITGIIILAYSPEADSSIFNSPGIAVNSLIVLPLESIKNMSKSVEKLKETYRKNPVVIILN
jgi:hypothetical protein